MELLLAGLPPGRCGRQASQESLLTPHPPLFRLLLQGWASRTLPPPGQMPDNPSMAPLLETLLEHVAPPPTEPLDGGYLATPPALQVHGSL
jgi:hypothetical protein